ncbi:MAG: hypothetical protein ABI135_11955 [Rhodoferax sp.]
MKSKRRYLANFEARSVMLIAAWTLGGAAAVHAQTPSPRSRTGASLTALSGDMSGNKVDAAHDGFISSQEYRKAMI